MSIIAVLLSYLAGSVSFPWLVARMHGVDLRRTGSRKLGGGNLMRTVGLWPGIAAGVLDGAKGFFAYAAANTLGLSVDTQLACGIAALMGQMWPVFHQFDGGRANATGWGLSLAVDPIAAFIMGIPLYLSLVAVRIVRPRPTRLIPVASLLSFVIFPAVIWEQEGVTPPVVAGLVVLALIIVRRLTAGVRADLSTGASAARVFVNRALFDRSELQQRGDVAI